DRDELKKPFRVRLRATHLTNQLRQAGRKHRHRKLTLARAVQSSDQRPELVLVHVLKFIDEQHNTGAVLTRRGPDGSKTIGQIGIEISAVGKAPLRFEVRADLDVPILDLESFRESSERPAGSCEVGPPPFAAIKTQQGNAKNRR